MYVSDGEERADRSIPASQSTISEGPIAEAYGPCRLSLHSENRNPRSDRRIDNGWGLLSLFICIHTTLTEVSIVDVINRSIGRCVLILS
ncbi:hypothetical protein VTO42DRAFT_7595 [Malbranchea cinnamomea]